MKKNNLLPQLIMVALFALLAAAPGYTANLEVIGTASYGGSTYNLVWEQDNNGKSLVWLDYAHKPDQLTKLKSWAAGLDQNLTYHLESSKSVTWLGPWRLPVTTDGPLDESCDGSTSVGWNVTSSEMGHLYYVSLENKGKKNSDCSQIPNADFKQDPFRNLLNGDCWSGNVKPGSNRVYWVFNFNNGEQRTLGGDGWSMPGLAVREAEVIDQENLVCSDKNVYYIPYFASAADKWTGLGLANDNPSQKAEICVSLFARDGAHLSIEKRVIHPNGQKAFPVGTPPATGWIKILSSEPLSGLSFVGVGPGGESLMADIPFVSRKSMKLVIPQVAFDDLWDTRIFIANPNPGKTTISLMYVNSEGLSPFASKNLALQENCSTEVDVAELLGGSTATNGKVLINATKEIVAFALYNDVKSGGHYFAGISAEILHQTGK